VSNPHSPRWLRRTGTPRLEFGADYNPDQWPRPVWDDDVRAMREAGVTVVSLAIFSWARLEPAAGRYDFGWLDDAMDLLHANGILVDLATATASPPPWLTTAHPEILPVDRLGHTIWPGGRQHWRPTSPVFREHALRLVRAMATRYAEHPALTAWHVTGRYNDWQPPLMAIVLKIVLASGGALGFLTLVQCVAGVFGIRALATACLGFFYGDGISPRRAAG